MEDKQSPLSLGAYEDIINAIDDPKARGLVQKSYENKLSLLTEFGHKMKGITEQFDLENTQDPDEFRKFVEATSKIATQESINYIDADNNFLKAVSWLKNEDYWRVRKELYQQNKYLSLGIFVYRHSRELRGFLDGKISIFNLENTASHELDNFRDREQTTIEAWQVGGKFIQDFLKAKSLSRVGSSKEWNCPNTRNLLLENNLIPK